MPNYDKWKLQAPPENENESMTQITRCPDCYGFFDEDGNEALIISEDYDYEQCRHCKAEFVSECGGDD
jgi:hypothetical protein